MVVILVGWLVVVIVHALIKTPICWSLSYSCISKTSAQSLISREKLQSIKMQLLCLVLTLKPDINLVTGVWKCVQKHRWEWELWDNPFCYCSLALGLTDSSVKMRQWMQKVWKVLHRSIREGRNIITHVSCIQSFHAHKAIWLIL